MGLSNAFIEARRKAAAMVREAGIRITPEEEQQIVVNDFELGNLAKEGAQLLEWVATKRVNVRLIVLLPFQTLPQHYHKATADDPGKEETIQMVSGTLYLYVPGEENMLYGFIPEGQDPYYTARHEAVLKSGDQLTLEPGTLHWFQSGREGAVMYSFTSQARDRLNIFTNPRTIKGCINDLE